MRFFASGERDVCLSSPITSVRAFTFSYQLIHSFYWIFMKLLKKLPWNRSKATRIWAMTSLKLIHDPRPLQNICQAKIAPQEHLIRKRRHSAFSKTLSIVLAQTIDAHFYFLSGFMELLTFREFSANGMQLSRANFSHKGNASVVVRVWTFFNWCVNRFYTQEFVILKNFSSFIS